MKKMLAAAIVVCALGLPAKADECAYRLVSFNGLNGAGFVLVQPWVEPGDVLLSIVSTIGDGTDYAQGYFERQVQVIPTTSPLTANVGVQQASPQNLSALHFVALVCRRAPGVK